MDLVPLRRAIFRAFADTGRPPALAPEELTALAAAHAVVLGEDGGIAFANPFAAGPSAFLVETERGTYDAVCAWDALGIIALLGTDGTARTTCADCGDEIVVGVGRGVPLPVGALVHFLVPAAQWYEDLGFA